jgi:hypothetical protein
MNFKTIEDELKERRFKIFEVENKEKEMIKTLSEIAIEIHYENFKEFAMLPISILTKGNQNWERKSDMAFYVLQKNPNEDLEDKTHINLGFDIIHYDEKKMLHLEHGSEDYKSKNPLPPHFESWNKELEKNRGYILGHLEKKENMVKRVFDSIIRTPKINLKNHLILPGSIVSNEKNFQSLMAFYYKH